jgi:hypothetical protein
MAERERGSDRERELKKPGEEEVQCNRMTYKCAMGNSKNGNVGNGKNWFSTYTKFETSGTIGNFSSSPKHNTR